MKTYYPQQRNKIALNLETLNDSEVKGILTQLETLQKETKGLNSSFSTQAQAAEQEVQSILNKIKKTDTEFNQLLESIKTQIQQIINSSLKYIQMNEGDLTTEPPKFRDSFIYLTKDAVSNLQELVNGLKGQLGDILTTEVEQAQEIEMDLNTSDVINPPLTPEPSKLLQSSIREITANILDEVMKTVEKIEPILNQAKGVEQNNKEIVGKLEEVVGTLSQTQTPEEDSAFSPELEMQETPEGINTEVVETSEEEIPEAEVEEAGELEGDFEAPATEEPISEVEEDEDISEIEEVSGGEELEESEPKEPKEPKEPVEKAEPKEPVEKVEPKEPAEKAEPAEKPEPKESVETIIEE